VIDAWHALLRPEVELSPAFVRGMASEMRARGLTFGDRVHCPFLRPFFLSETDEILLLRSAEALAAMAERVIEAALESPGMLAQLGVTEPEMRLIRIDPGYLTASTASRADAFLLPGQVHFAEYNAESPAGPGYTQRLCELFDELPIMDRFRQRRFVRFHRTIDALLGALLASYHEWGGRASPPRVAIVDWREVPTWSEFEILRDAFTASGVPTLVCDPRGLVFDDGVLSAEGQRIDLVYRRVLVNDILARPSECAALVAAYEARAVCVANSLRCKLAHKKALFAVLTDPSNARMFSAEEHETIRASVPWTRVLAHATTEWHERRDDLPELALRGREQLVLKPNDEYGGKGVVLGWETPEAEWHSRIDAALADPPGTWIVQARVPVRREVFPQFDANFETTMREMLVDLAPYLFRGRMTGYLTRLSASGLANVTSGGGQVPAFVVGRYN
jgi:uncharacterized circularly permuted ATP-grasp superfamily protein